MTDEVLRVGFDLGGVVTKYPEQFRPLLEILFHNPKVEVFIVTDMREDKARDMLHLNRMDWLVGRVVSADYDRHGENCKAVLCQSLKIDILIDDHMGYLAIVGRPPVRLFVMPDPSLPYYEPDWKTDGSEGRFGRRNPPGSKRPPEDRGQK
jgi:hypothetical protein